jgi:CubicO group peptidase (beta-lactamase class C family)
MTSLEQRIDAIFSQWDKPDSPGCILALIQNGEFRYKRGYGMADLERNVPISADSLFDLGSTGKQFTAMIIAILASQGKLNLDDPIRKHLPEMHACTDRVSIRHLVHHTSGIRDYLTLMNLRGMIFENLYSEELLFDLITRQTGLNFEPGSEFLYSNSGYFLLGTIAARVTGKHLVELIQEYILTPLGMTHTTTNQDFRPIVRNRALSYEAGKTEGEFINALALSGGTGDGALLSCVDDLFLWDRNFYNNKLNNAQPDLLDQMHTTGRLNTGKSIQYAFGLFIDTYKGQKRVSHGGSWAGYRAEMMRFPEQRATLICISNLGSTNPTELCEQVADIVLEDVLTPEAAGDQTSSPAPQTGSASHLDNFCGIYQGELLTFEIFTRDGHLFFDTGNREFQLTLLGGRKFQLEQYPVFLSLTGKNNQKLVITEGEKDTPFKRIRSERYVPPALSPFAGVYYSAELDIRYKIIEKDGGLFLLKTPFDSPIPVKVFAPNSLRTQLGELRLQLGRNGSIKGFDLNAGRVIHIKFRKTG